MKHYTVLDLVNTFQKAISENPSYGEKFVALSSDAEGNSYAFLDSLGAEDKVVVLWPKHEYLDSDELLAECL